MRIPFLATFLFPLAVVAQDHGKQAAIDFEKQVWPILEKRCVECHQTAHLGPDGKQKKPKGGVVFDHKDGITGSKKGKLVVAKKPDDSLIYTAISLPADHEDRMPPAKKGGPLAKDEIALIKQWIDEGASFGKWTGQKTEGAEKKGEKGGKDEKNGKPASGKGEESAKQG
jgi:uncharacterized membrane protein